MGTRKDEITHDIEYELTLRLERASDLSERAKRANDAARHEIDRANGLVDHTSGSARDLERERHSHVLIEDARADRVETRRRPARRHVGRVA